MPFLKYASLGGALRYLQSSASPIKPSKPSRLPAPASAKVRIPDRGPWIIPPRTPLGGNVLVLHFWTAGCVNCRHTVPALRRMERETHAGVRLVSIHSPKFDHEREEAAVRAAARRLGIVAHPVLNDKKLKYWKKVGAHSWPSFAVVDRDGTVAGVFEGSDRAADAERLAISLAGGDPAAPGRPVERLRGPGPEAGAPGSAPLASPGGLAVDPASGRVFVSDSSWNRILVLDDEGRVRQCIGSVAGAAGFEDSAGDPGAARFRGPQGLAWDPDGRTLYVADADNDAVRAVRFDRDGGVWVETPAGFRRPGDEPREEGAGRPTPWDVAVAGGVVFVACAGSHQLCFAEAAELERGEGSFGVLSGRGDEAHRDVPRFGWLAPGRRPVPLPVLLGAGWAQPSGLAAVPAPDGGATLYVADAESSSVRALALSPAGAALWTLAGGDPAVPYNLFAFGDEEGRASPVADLFGMGPRLQHPMGVAAVPEGPEWGPLAGRLVVCDTYNNKVRWLDPGRRELRTLAGSGAPGLSDGLAKTSAFREPAAAACAPGPTPAVLIADRGNGAIRRVERRDGEWYCSTMPLRRAPQRLQPIRLPAGRRTRVRVQVRPAPGYKFADEWGFYSIRWSLGGASGCGMLEDEYGGATVEVEVTADAGPAKPPVAAVEAVVREPAAAAAAGRRGPAQSVRQGGKGRKKKRRAGARSPPPLAAIAPVLPVPPVAVLKPAAAPPPAAPTAAAAEPASAEPLSLRLQFSLFLCGHAETVDGSGEGGACTLLEFEAEAPVELIDVDDHLDYALDDLVDDVEVVAPQP